MILQSENRFIGNLNSKSGSISPENRGNKKISEYLNEMNHNIENRESKNKMPEIFNKRRSQGISEDQLPIINQQK